MIVVLIVNCLVTATAVLIHYEALLRLTLLLQRLRMHHRYRILLGVFGALIAHTLEVWVFAIAYYYMHHAPGWGELQGNFDGSLIDCSYFSFTTYTTLGFGDIQPIGDLRFLGSLQKTENKAR